MEPNRKVGRLASLVVAGSSCLPYPRAEAGSSGAAGARAAEVGPPAGGQGPGQLRVWDRPGLPAAVVPETRAGRVQGFDIDATDGDRQADATWRWSG